MAHKKGMGSSKNGRDSNSQRLGIKRFGGEFVQPGAIYPGAGVGVGRDHTIYAKVEGAVQFAPYAKGRRKKVSVVPEEASK